MWELTASRALQCHLIAAEPTLPDAALSCQRFQLPLCEATTTSRREFCCKSKSHENNGIKAGKDLRMLCSLSTTKLFMALGRLSLGYYSPRNSRATKVTPSRWLSRKTMKKWRERTIKRKKEKCWFCFTWFLEDFLPFHTHPTPNSSKILPSPTPASPKSIPLSLSTQFCVLRFFFSNSFSGKVLIQGNLGPHWGLLNLLIK